MSRSQYSAGAEQVFMSDEDRKTALNAFSLRFSRRIDAICAALQAGLTKTRVESYVDIYQRISERIPRGLLAILRNQQASAHHSELDHAYFFLFYFTRLLKQARPEEINVLVGRFNDALNVNSKFNDLFWEMSIARTFQSHGCDVEFVSPSPDRGVQTPDLKIKSREGVAYAECKSVSVLSRLPLPSDTLTRGAKLIADHFANIAEPGQFVLFAKYKGVRKELAEDVLDDLRKCLVGFNIGEVISESVLWHLRLDLNLSKYTDDIKKIMFTRLSERPEALRGLMLTEVGDRRLLVFSADQIYGLSKTIGDRVEKAFKQLPDDGLRFILLQISDYLAGDKQEFDAMINYAASDQRTVSLARKNIKNDNGFIGVFLSGAHWFEARGNLKFLNCMQSGLATSNKYYLRKYYVGMLGWTKDDFERSYPD